MTDVRRITDVLRIRAATMADSVAHDDTRRVLTFAQWDREADEIGGGLAAAELVAALPETKRALVRQRLLDYLGTNQNLLDMYLVPSSAIMKKMEMPILP